MSRALRWALGLGLWVTAPAHAQEWAWVEAVGGAVGTDRMMGWDAAFGGVADLYMVGSFTGTAQATGGPVLASVGYRDIYLGQFHVDGGQNWAASFGGSNNDWAYGVAANTTGAVYITGTFSGRIDFGPTILYTAGSADAFVAKLDATGTPLWAVRGGSPQYDFPYRIQLDGAGDVYLTGTHTGVASAGGTTLPYTGGRDAFLVKISSAGVVQWGVTANGAQDVNVRAMTVLPDGTVFLGGDFSGSATFGTSTFVAQGPRDGWIAQVSPAGTIVGAVQLGGTDSEWVRAVASVGGQVFVAGTFDNQTDLGPFSLAGSTYEMFVARVNGLGQVTAATAPGLRGGVGDLTATPDLLLLAGGFIGSATVGGTLHVSAGDQDGFVASVGPDTTLASMVTLGGTGRDYVKRVDRRRTGHVHAVGTFEGTAAFDDIFLAATGASEAFVGEIFLGAFAP